MSVNKREVAECLKILNTYKSGWVNIIYYDLKESRILDE